MARRRRVAGVATVALTALVGSAADGAAHPLRANGGTPEILTDDWSASGHLLCKADNQGCAGQAYEGGTVAAWQRVLYADYYIPNCGSSGIDGQFGQYTHDATKRWQEDHALTVDGQVGPQTWGRAGRNLGRPGVTSTSVYYVGSRTNVYFTVGDWGEASDYYNKTPSGSWWTSHPGHYSYPYC